MEILSDTLCKLCLVPRSSTPSHERWLYDEKNDQVLCGQCAADEGYCYPEEGVTDVPIPVSLLDRR